jgi:hypothetical protein
MKWAVPQLGLVEVWVSRITLRLFGFSRMSIHLGRDSRNRSGTITAESQVHNPLHVSTS